jgi:hypothetical protein
MCWNAPISLISFIIGISIIALLFYLDYDIKYIIIALSFIFMQLIEFFIWIYINNKQISFYLSILTFIIIFLQPIIILYFINDYKYLITYYILIQLFIFLFAFFFLHLTFNFKPIVASNHHLNWNWTSNYYYFISFGITYLIFFLGAIYLTGHHIIFIIAIITYLYSLYTYYHYGTVSTMWCWFAVILIIYMLFDAIYSYPYPYSYKLK